MRRVVFSPSIAAALTAAALFGASMPLANALLRDLSPVLLAGLLYLGSGVGLGLIRITRNRGWRTPPMTRRHYCVPSQATVVCSVPMAACHALRFSGIGAAAAERRVGLLDSIWRAIQANTSIPRRTKPVTASRRCRYINQRGSSSPRC